MPRRLPVLTLALTGTLLVLAVVRVVRAEEGPARQVPVAVPSQAYPQVKLDPLGDGPAVEGTLKMTSVEVRTAEGTRVIDVAHVARITFPKDRTAQSQDAVELDSKDVVRGQVTTAVFPVESDGRTKDWKRDELRELRTVKEKTVSVLGLAVGLLTLSVMEIVLGIDNIIFLAIVAARLPKDDQPRARKIGLAAALGTRILLLFSLTWLLGLTAPIFTLPDLPQLHDLEAREVSGRDLILFGGGLFLIFKSVREMHKKLEEAKEKGDEGGAGGGKVASFAGTIATIAVIDIVFSLDSVITAVGMVDNLYVMIGGMVIAMMVMWRFAGPVSDFVDHHPTIKVLALAFLILIGVMLVAEGLGQHIDKGYIYFAMAFAVVIELVNMRLRGSDPAVAAATAEKPTQV